jgi:hypothetical protein
MASLVLIVSASACDAANRLGEGMGWGARNYSLPLSPSGAAPATHWAGHLANAQPEFLDMLTAAQAGDMPERLTEAGYPAADFATVCGELTMDVSEGDPSRHFARVCAAMGLALVQETQA